jgi:hypothetical protein
MPTWLDCQTHAAAGLTDPAGLGVPGTLPDGSLVYGVFSLFGDRAPTDGEPGRRMRLEQQHNPVWSLKDADAVGLAEADEVVVLEQTWRITAPPTADGNGMTPLVLAPVQALPGDAARWR